MKLIYALWKRIKRENYNYSYTPDKPTYYLHFISLLQDIFVCICVYLKEKERKMERKRNSHFCFEH